MGCVVTRAKIVARLLAVLVIALAGLVATPSTATAAGCSGTGCTGRDPQAQGCDADAYTAAEYSIIGRPGDMGYNQGSLRVEVRHSNACRARWLRLTHSNNGGCGGGWGLRGRIRDMTAGDAQLSLQFANGHCNQWWTPMVGRTSSSSYVQYCNLSIVNGNPTVDVCSTKAWP